ncbi:hypothetical protein RHM66_01460 [Pseudomonas sp. RTB3]|nr:hypothetical protein RHM66_01460 [Pseudomonas sp. RTB3]
MVGLAFSIAASCNFPVLLLSMYLEKPHHPWRHDRWLAGSDQRRRPDGAGPDHLGNDHAPRESHLPV